MHVDAGSSQTGGEDRHLGGQRGHGVECYDPFRGDVVAPRNREIAEIARWKTATGEIEVDSGILVGVLNTTPDSFSDGGEFTEPAVAVDAGLRMIREGASLVDVGGESTRPGARAVSVAEELDRVIPVVEQLAGRGARVSIDTSKADVALAAIAAGASVINDVTGFRHPEMVDAAVETGAGVVVMHMRGDPRTMQADPRYDDVVVEVKEYLERQAEALVAAGVDGASIVVDPGFGFGKTARHNLELLSRLGEIVATGYPVMIGTSRKSTLRAITGEVEPRRRDGATAVTTALGFDRGARLFRVHNVPVSLDALRVAAAIVDPKIWEEWRPDSSPGDSPG